MTSASSGGGETRENPSGWTVDTLKVYVQTQIDMMMASELRQLAHLQNMLDERYLTQTTAVAAAFEAQQLAMTTALTAADTAVKAALASQEKAVIKQELSTNERFAAVNEFRAQLTDQASLFMPRAEAESGMARNTERITELSAIANTHLARSEFNAIHEALLVRVQDLADRVNRAEGSSGGAQNNRAQLISFITTALAVIAVIVTIYVAFKTPAP